MVTCVRRPLTFDAPSKSVGDCLSQAGKANGVSLALDAAAIGVGFIPGGTAATAGLNSPLQRELESLVRHILQGLQRALGVGRPNSVVDL